MVIYWLSEGNRALIQIHIKLRAALKVCLLLDK